MEEQINYPWNKGLTKETDKRLRTISKKRTGKGNPMYGRHQSSEWIENKRLEMTGHLVSKETREKLILARIGFKHTEESKIKIGLLGRGRVPWNKGLHNFHSKEVIAKMSLSQKKRFKDNPMQKGFHLSEEHKAKLKITRARQIVPLKDTLIELKIQDLLSQLHVEYIAHKYISEITHKYQCDIFVPEQLGINQKTIIECDGCFFHCCPICKVNITNWTKERKKLDTLRTKELIENGFRVIRLWEHEIKVMDANELNKRLK